MRERVWRRGNENCEKWWVNELLSFSSSCYLSERRTKDAHMVQESVKNLCLHFSILFFFLILLSFNFFCLLMVSMTLFPQIRKKLAFKTTEEKKKNQITWIIFGVLQKKATFFYKDYFPGNNKYCDKTLMNKSTLWFIKFLTSKISLKQTSGRKREKEKASNNS